MIYEDLRHIRIARIKLKLNGCLDTTGQKQERRICILTWKRVYVNTPFHAILWKVDVIHVQPMDIKHYRILLSFLCGTYRNSLHEQYFWKGTTLKKYLKMQCCDATTGVCMPGGSPTKSKHRKNGSGTSNSKKEYKGHKGKTYVWCNYKKNRTSPTNTESGPKILGEFFQPKHTNILWLTSWNLSWAVLQTKSSSFLSSLNPQTHVVYLDRSNHDL